MKISLPSLDKQAKEFIASGKTLKTLKVRELTPFHRAAPPVNEWKVGEDAVKWKKDVTTKGDKCKQHEPPAGKKGKRTQHKPAQKSKKPTPVDLDDSDATYVPKDCEFMLILSCLISTPLATSLLTFIKPKDEVNALKKRIMRREHIEGELGKLSDVERNLLEGDRAKLRLWMKNRERHMRAESETKNKKKVKPKVTVS